MSNLRGRAHVAPLPVVKAKSPEEIGSLIFRLDKRNAKSMAFMKDVLLSRLLHAGLSVRTSDGVRGLGGEQAVFLQVFASERRLLAEAERLQLSFRLDKKALRQADVALNSELVTKGVVFGAAGCPLPELAIPVKPWTWLQTQYDPYAYHWAQYVPRVAHLYSVSPTTGSIISQTTALKLLKTIVELPVSEGGAGFDLEQLVLHKCVGCLQAH